MFKVKKILFPTDFSETAEKALMHAIFLAKKYNAELHILHAIIMYDNYEQFSKTNKFPEVDELESRLKIISDEKMLEVINSPESDGLNIVCKNERGVSAASVILEYSQDEDIDLVILGTHGRRGIEHLFLGSVAEEIVRYSKAPVLTIRRSSELKPVESFKNILVPIDFSENSKICLRHASEVARMYNSKLHLLHIIEKNAFPTFYLTDKTPLEDFVNKLKEKSLESLHKVVEECCTIDNEINYHVIEGHAARDIVKFSSDNENDLIVISSHGLNGIEHFLLGSVTEKVVRRSSSPVFIIKPYGKSLI